MGGLPPCRMHEEMPEGMTRNHGGAIQITSSKEGVMDTMPMVMAGQGHPATTSHLQGGMVENPVLVIVVVGDGVSQSHPPMSVRWMMIGGDRIGGLVEGMGGVQGMALLLGRRKGDGGTMGK